MDNLKESWNNIDEISGIPGFGLVSPERFIQGRSQSLYENVRSIFIRDFIFKGIGAMFIIANIFFYSNDIQVRNLNFGLLIFHLLLTLLATRHFAEYLKVSDPGKSPKVNLSTLLVYLERRFSITALFRATTYFFGFVPGLILYFYLAYGYMKEMVPMSWFVFSFLCCLGMVSGFILDTRQVRFHINHIKLCLSDLNEDTLALAYRTIESRRKMDHIMVLATFLMILLIFLIFIIILTKVVR